MKKSLTGLFFLLVFANCFAQDAIYNSSTLPEDLKKDAHSAKREETIKFEVKDIDEAFLSVHQVYTVLDAEAKDVLLFKEYSDDFRKLQNAEIKVFDASGKSVNRYKMKELQSIAVGDGLVVDGKIYYFRVSAPSYPVTVQFDYQLKYKGTLQYPDYLIQDPEQSVENSSYTINVPLNLDIKFKAQKTNIEPIIKSTDKNKTYTWTAKNILAIPYEEGSVSYENSYPAILVSPGKFSMDGNEGSLESWKTFGSWYAQLTKGSLNLPDQTKSFLVNLVKDETSEIGKIKVLYHYLQTNCRYVSIQLGIGGFKPFDAAFVDSKKYGDCKALTNYMQAMLNAVRINSYPALVNASYNKQPVDPSFPHNSFNHVILCVPGIKDTTWLECTSKSSMPGILGNFTENRNALLVMPTGGVLVATPKSKATENSFSIHTMVSLNEDGSGESESNLETRGEYKEDIIDNVLDEKKDDQKNYLVKKLGFLQPDSFDLTTDKENNDNTYFKLTIEKVPEFTAGSKMFLNPRIYKMWQSSLPKTEKRTKDFYLPFPFLKTDTTVYHLPAGYTVENLPSARNVSCDYGRFTTDYTYDESSNSVTSIALLQFDQHVIAPEKYQAAAKFFSNVIEEYTEKIVIKKK